MLSNIRKKFILFILCFIIFLDFLGYGIILPTIVPMLFSNEIHLLPDNLDQHLKYFIFSIVLSIFPIGLFFGGFFIGSLADKYGRKKTLILSLTGTIIGYATFLIGFLYENIMVLIIGRGISGFMSGNVALANTIISDISDSNENSKNYSFVTLSIGLGIILGPFLGSKLSNVNEYDVNFNLLNVPSIMLPYYIAVFLSTIAFILVIFFIPETFNHQTIYNKQISFKKAFKNFIFNLTKAKMKHIFLSSFLLFLTFNIFVYTLNIYLYDTLKFSTNEIGDFLTYVGICLVISMGIITPLISKYFKPYQILKISLIGLFIILISTLFILNRNTIHLLTSLFIVFYGITYTNIVGLISLLAQEDQKGASFGTNQSLHAIAEGIAPIIATNTFYLSSKMPFSIISFIAIFSWLILVTKIKNNLNN